MILCVCPNPSIDTLSWIGQILPAQVNRIAKQKEFPGGRGVYVALEIKEIGGSSAYPEDVRHSFIEPQETTVGTCCHVTMYQSIILINTTDKEVLLI